MKNETGHNKIIMLSAARLAADETGEQSDDWKGTRFRKQIASYGEWVDPYNPLQKMILDEAFGDQMIANFDKMRAAVAAGDKEAVLPRVAVPVNHTDDAHVNTGEVVALESVAGDGIYATLEIRDWGTSWKLEDGLIFDVSMGFDWDYIDTKKGEHHGIVLEHVALVNNPYLTGMSAFERAPEQVEKDEAQRKLWEQELEWYDEFSNSHKEVAVMLSKTKAKEISMKKRKLAKEQEVVEVTNDRDFDVTITVNDEDGEAVEQVVAAGATVEVPADQEADVKKQIADAEAPEGEEEGEESLSHGDGEGEGDEEGAGDGEGAGEGEGSGEGEGGEGEGSDAALSKSEREELSRLRAAKLDTDAEVAYTTLLSAGSILPAQKDQFIQLHKAAQGITGKVTLSRDKKKVELSAADALIDLVKAGGKRVNFNQEGSQSDAEGDQGGNVAASANLSKETLEGLKANGITPEKIDDLAAKSPLYAAEMAKLNKKD